MRGKKTISSLSHTCLLFTSMRPRSFHRCRPYFMKIWGRSRDMGMGEMLSAHPGPPTTRPKRGTGTQDKAHPHPPGPARTAGREESRSPSVSPKPHEPRTGRQRRAGRNLPALQEKAEGRQGKMCWCRAGAGEGCLTFHPDVELAQLALQLALQQAHVLGTRDRAPVTHSPWCQHPPSPPSAWCLTSVYSL